MVTLPGSVNSPKINDLSSFTGISPKNNTENEDERKNGCVLIIFPQIYCFVVGGATFDFPAAHSRYSCPEIVLLGFNAIRYFKVDLTAYRAI